MRGMAGSAWVELNIRDVQFQDVCMNVYAPMPPLLSDYSETCKT